jgi:hypothetical protein
MQTKALTSKPHYPILDGLRYDLPVRKWLKEKLV